MGSFSRCCGHSKPGRLNLRLSKKPEFASTILGCIIFSSMSGSPSEKFSLSTVPDKVNSVQAGGEFRDVVSDDFLSKLTIQARTYALDLRDNNDTVAKRFLVQTVLGVVSRIQNGKMSDPQLTLADFKSSNCRLNLHQLQVKPTSGRAL